MAYLIVALMIGAICVFMVRSYRKIGQPSQPQEFVTESDPLLEQRATVMDKQLSPHIRGRDSKGGYWLTFRLQDGRELELSVPLEAYNQAVVGETDVLITRGGEFFDFAWRAAEDCPV